MFIFNAYCSSWYLKTQRKIYKNIEDETHRFAILMLIYFKITSDIITYLPYNCGLHSKQLTLLLSLLQVFLALKDVGSNSAGPQRSKFSSGKGSRGDAVLSHLLGVHGVSWNRTC